MVNVAVFLLAAMWVGMVWLLIRVISDQASYFDPRPIAVLLFTAAAVASVAALRGFWWMRTSATGASLARFWLSVAVVWSCALALTFTAVLA